MAWALTGAVGTGTTWAVALVIGFTLFGVRFSTSDVSHPLTASLFVTGAAVVIGLGTGAAVGLWRGRDARGTAALMLGVIGALTGCIGGGLSVPAVIAFDGWLHPIASSALAWMLAGLIASLIGCNWAQWTSSPDPPAGEEYDTAPPPRIEWLLRQRERRLRDWPLFRVLPVLVTSALALVGAAVLASSDSALPLAAVGVLGASVALVLQAQERRLRNLETHLRQLERRFRGASEDEPVG